MTTITAYNYWGVFSFTEGCTLNKTNWSNLFSFIIAYFMPFLCRILISFCTCTYKINQVPQIASNVQYGTRLRNLKITKECGILLHLITLWPTFTARIFVLWITCEFWFYLSVRIFVIFYLAPLISTLIKRNSVRWLMRLQGKRIVCQFLSNIKKHKISLKIEFYWITVDS